MLNPGDGAFYGPKIDFHIEDVMGRTWQCATCQLDFAMPERLDIDYVGEDNQRHRPVMIHRTVLGSIERFLAILIEHYGGALPAWLAPVQASVVPVADRHNDYANQVKSALDLRRAARRGRPASGVGRQEDPRRRGGQSAVHARGGRPRSGGGHRHRAHARQQGHPDDVARAEAATFLAEACSLPDSAVVTGARSSIERLHLERWADRLYCGLA